MRSNRGCLGLIFGHVGSFLESQINILWKDKHNLIILAKKSFLVCQKGKKLEVEKRKFQLKIAQLSQPQILSNLSFRKLFSVFYYHKNFGSAHLSIKG